jgi:hypothetical protein
MKNDVHTRKWQPDDGHASKPVPLDFPKTGYAF